MIGYSPTTIDKVRHPHYVAWYPDFQKFRTVFEGGQHFINTYLEKFSSRETDADFATRKSISYAPAHAKAAIIDIRNAIFQRMADIIRRGGPRTYKDAIAGKERGVDMKGNSMNSFIGRLVLPELLVLSRVGIYIDKPPVPDGSTLKTTRTMRPYLYYYPAEDIRSWHYNDINELDVVLLQDHYFTTDDETGLITGQESRFRLLRLTSKGVEVTFYQRNKQNEFDKTTTLLNLKRIPFVILELSHSLLQDVADYQIALLNLASSDMNYALKSNFPFYTEQVSPTSLLPHIRSGATEGTSSEAATAQTESINVGATQGRAYPKGLERPGFIHPSSEPIKASMEKQQRMVEEIRQLVNLALSNIRPVRASAESKQIDNQGLEAGLSYIGIELETAEREIAKIWSEYESEDEVTHVKYPDNYQLRTDKDRRTEAKELEDLKKGTPSQTYKKVLSKEIARVTVGTKISPEEMEKIEQEIDAAVVVDTDPEVIRSDHESGFVSTATASTIRGYPKGEAEKAKIDHADRLRRIAEAQSPTGMAARGISDAGDPNEGRDEKATSRNTDEEETTTSRVRGEGQ